MTQDILKYLSETLTAAGYNTDISYMGGIDRIIQSNTNNLGKVWVTYNSNTKQDMYADGDYAFQNEAVTLYYFAKKNESDSPLKKANQLYMSLDYQYNDDTYGSRHIQSFAMRPIDEDTNYVIYEIDIEVNNA